MTHSMIGRELYEKIEDLFSLRISSSGADITIKLGGEQMTVDYEAFLTLRNSIESLITQTLKEAIPEKKYPVPISLPVTFVEPIIAATANTMVSQEGISNYGYNQAIDDLTESLERKTNDVA